MNTIPTTTFKKIFEAKSYDGITVTIQESIYRGCSLETKEYFVCASDKDNYEFYQNRHQTLSSALADLHCF